MYQKVVNLFHLDIKEIVNNAELLSVFENFHELEKSQYEQSVPKDEVNDIDIDEGDDGSDVVCPIYIYIYCSY